MSDRLFAISDLHGHYNEYIALEAQLLADGMDPWEDTLVFLGDYVDGGPNTKQLLDALITRSKDYPHWVFLMGNHEDLMLDALRWNERVYGSYDLWWGQGGRETADSYFQTLSADAYDRALMSPKDYIPAEHLDWLESRRLRHEQGEYHFVHAGFRPGVPLDEQSREDVLWIRESFYTANHDFGQPVIFGHTTFQRPLIVRTKVFDDQAPIVAIGIDGMRHNTGNLVAVELPKRGKPRFFFQPALTPDDVDFAA